MFPGWTGAASPRPSGGLLGTARLGLGGRWTPPGRVPKRVAGAVRVPFRFPFKAG